MNVPNSGGENGEKNSNNIISIVDNKINTWNLTNNINGSVSFTVSESNKHILQQGIIKNNENLVTNAATGNIHNVKIALENGADVNFRDDQNLTALFRAIIAGQDDMVKHLLNEGASVNVWANDSIVPLYTASEYNRCEAIEAILQTVNDKDKNKHINIKQSHGLTPIHVAAIKGNLEAITKLLIKGAEVDARTNEGLTPLYYACQCGHFHVVKLLLKYGADINARRNLGYTPLYATCLNGHLEVAKVLVRHDALINIRSDNHSSPLFVAALYNQADIVNVLLDKGADIEIKGPDNVSPLHAACLNNSVESVKVLKKRGANTKTMDNEVNIPFKIALQRRKRLNKKFVDSLTYPAQIFVSSALDLGDITRETVERSCKYVLKALIFSFRRFFQ